MNQSPIKTTMLINLGRKAAVVKLDTSFSEVLSDSFRSLCHLLMSTLATFTVKVKLYTKLSVLTEQSCQCSTFVSLELSRFSSARLRSGLWASVFIKRKSI